MPTKVLVLPVCINSPEEIQVGPGLPFHLMVHPWHNVGQPSHSEEDILVHGYFEFLKINLLPLVPQSSRCRSSRVRQGQSPWLGHTQAAQCSDDAEH